MNFSIFYKNSGLKNNTSKGMKRAISALEVVISANLKKNPHFAGVKSITLTMTLCGKSKIKKLNDEYRKINKVTDVLSFPVYENLRPDKKPKVRNQVLMDLGDLVICKEKAQSQAKEFGITFEQELIHLAVHGYLHLLGFDHEKSAREEKLMEIQENLLVGKVYKKLF
jgi:probable rRNA maturation factor